MKQLYLFPPNYRTLVRAFPIRGKPMFFCYGNVIYNPTRRPIPPEIIAHERVHSMQQAMDSAGGPARWWERYIEDKAFRLDQELPAHRAEFEHLGFVEDGRARDKALRAIAERLASPLYGNLISLDDARTRIAGCQRNSAAGAM